MSERRRVPESEAALVQAFITLIDGRNARIDENRARAEQLGQPRRKWTIYPEACGWDLVLAEEETSVQIGIEAKLAVNAKVIHQALRDTASRYWDRQRGPDYRAILVPAGGRNLELREICSLVGLTVLSLYDSRPYADEPDWHWSSPSSLPDEERCDEFSMGGWHSWFPAERLKLPDYIPDVRAGVKSPIQLTEWKIRAIKLWILLDRRGVVTRSDMKALGLSPTRFTDRFNGFLTPDPGRGGYVKHAGSPDFRAQHPRNYAEIEADFEKWIPPGYRIEAEATP